MGDAGPVSRLLTGVPGLDALLGGGLLPGTMTAVVGATGIGKTQLGLQFAAAGQAQEGRRGVVFDMSSRGDPQSHNQYTERMFQWRLQEADAGKTPDLDHFFEAQRDPADYLHVFEYSGRRVTRADLDVDDWHQWQGELNSRLRGALAFLYGALVRGARRVTIDGVEPADRPGDSIQFHLFEYLYHQVLRKDPEWVARDLFSERYRANAETIAAHLYDPSAVGCVLLCTSHEAMLDDLISRGIAEGDVLANANTLIYMGKIRDGSRIGRGLYVAKHRGSACSDEITPYTIGEQGVRVGEE